MPSSNSTFPKKEEVRCLKPLSKSIEIITPNVKARATVYSQTVKATGKDCYHQAIYLSRILLFPVLKTYMTDFLFLFKMYRKATLKLVQAAKSRMINISWRIVTHANCTIIWAVLLLH